jgi:CspA family cold shock protein
MAHGIVTWFDPQRGVGAISRAGFVSRDAGGTDVVVDHAQVATADAIVAGTPVRFTLEHHSTGLRAVEVHAI